MGKTAKVMEHIHSGHCRYHYNVADSRLVPHIEKGNEDGLFISCITSCSNLWAVIMDAGTGFTSQVYELTPHFLHKVSDLHLVSLKLETFTI